MKLEDELRNQLQDALQHLRITNSYPELVHTLSVLINKQSTVEEAQSVMPKLQKLADLSDESQSSSDEYECAPKSGPEAAQWLYGLCHFYGIGIAKNQKLGFQYIALAACSAFLPAHRSLGFLYCLEENIPKELLIHDKKFGALLLERSFKNGFLYSAIQLSKMYYKGIGVNKNAKLAIHYSKVMLERIDEIEGSWYWYSNRLNFLALRYESELSINDSLKSLEYYEMSTVTDTSAGPNYYNLADAYMKGFGTEINIPFTALLYGQMIQMKHNYGIEKLNKWIAANNFKFTELNDAIQIYRKAATTDNPDPFAEYVIGYCNLIAVGMPQDLNLASEFLKKAIQHGESCYRHLYLCYHEMLRRGMPVLENLKELYKTIELMATQGNTNRTQRYIKRRSRAVPYEVTGNQDKKTAIESKTSSEILNTAMQGINSAFSAINNQLFQLIDDIDIRIECAYLYAHLYEAGAPGLIQNITYGLKYYEMIKELMKTRAMILETYPQFKKEFETKTFFAFHGEKTKESPSNNYAVAKTEFYTPMLELTVYVSGSLKDIIPEKSIATTIAEYTFDP